MITKLTLITVAESNVNHYDTSYYRIEWTGSEARLTKLAPQLDTEENASLYYNSELAKGCIDSEQYADFMADGTRDRHWHTTIIYPTVASTGIVPDDMKAHTETSYIDIMGTEEIIKYTVLNHSAITTLDDLIEAYWNVGYCFIVKY